MKIFIIIVLTAILSMLLNCQKKTAIPEQKQVVLSKLYTIEGYPDEADSSRVFSLIYNGTRFDEKGNVFVFDEKSGSIRIFDKSGSFLTAVSGIGLGPDEIENLTTFYTQKDTIFVIDNRIKLKRFKLTGELISNTRLNNDVISLPFTVCVLNDTLLAVNLNTFKRTQETVEISKELALFDKNLKDKKTIYSYKTNINNIQKSVFEEPVFTFDRSYIYQSTKSKSEYKIKVFSYDGQPVKIIHQNYSKTKYTVAEMDYFRQKYKDDPDFNLYYDYRIAVNDLFTDKYGNIWVQRNSGLTGESIEITFDILKEENIITKLKMKLHGGLDEHKETEFFINDRFYIVDHTNNLIEVYDYKIE